jgi:hypothetical protein
MLFFFFFAKDGREDVMGFFDRWLHSQFSLTLVICIVLFSNIRKGAATARL